MSGHSKWASIKHKKGAADAKRGRIFTKLIREITVAAKEGGGNPDMNPTLRTAISRANDANMPKSNIENAIKKGTGELPGVVYEAGLLEGYASGGVAIIIETLTDNKNRTTAEVRNIFSKRGGNMASPGAVAWIFSKKGSVVIDKTKISEDELFNVSVEAGAEDVKSDGDNFEVLCAQSEFEAVKEAIKAKGVEWEMAELVMIPSSTVKVEGNTAKQVLALMEALEDHDDVQKVYGNFDIPDDVLESLAKEM